MIGLWWHSPRRCQLKRTYTNNCNIDGDMVYRRIRVEWTRTSYNTKIRAGLSCGQILHKCEPRDWVFRGRSLAWHTSDSAINMYSQNPHRQRDPDDCSSAYCTTFVCNYEITERGPSWLKMIQITSPCSCLLRLEPLPAFALSMVETALTERSRHAHI